MGDCRFTSDELETLATLLRANAKGVSLMVRLADFLEETSWQCSAVVRETVTLSAEKSA